MEMINAEPSFMFCNALVVVLIDLKLLLFFVYKKKPWHWPSLIVLYKILSIYHKSKRKHSPFFKLVGTILHVLLFGTLISLSCWFFFWIILLNRRKTFIRMHTCTFKAHYEWVGNEKGFFVSKRQSMWTMKLCCLHEL